MEILVMHNHSESLIKLCITIQRLFPRNIYSKHIEAWTEVGKDRIREELRKIFSQSPVKKKHDDMFHDWVFCYDKSSYEPIEWKELLLFIELVLESFPFDIDHNMIKKWAEVDPCLHSLPEKLASHFCVFPKECVGPLLGAPRIINVPGCKNFVPIDYIREILEKELSVNTGVGICHYLGILYPGTQEISDKKSVPQNVPPATLHVYTPNGLSLQDIKNYLDKKEAVATHVWHFLYLLRQEGDKSILSDEKPFSHKKEYFLMLYYKKEPLTNPFGMSVHKFRNQKIHLEMVDEPNLLETLAEACMVFTSLLKMR